ncbi:putative disease resistance RPP13-like protein 1 [Forsythia ovata]|uniref:Disease resistance RPP13-like protein 1 n=1 Tax=Forsythia ovata TaxID=205694 RepID=A0ABD1PXS4_9LAMI
MCGSGKSALARKVIFSSRVEELFELILWIDLSKAMKSEQKYECILVKKNDFEKISLNPCSGELREWLVETFLNPPKKCLVVLDGVWHVIDGLNTLIQDIVDSPINGSIIITSRRPQVVKKLLPNEKSYLHRIQPLSRDDCWSVFWHSIERKEFIYDNLREKILEMKDEILGRCDGLPLAVKTLAEIIAIQIGKEDFSPS